MDTDEIVKIIIFGVVLAVLGSAVALLFSGKGGAIFEALRNLFRFGG